MSADNVAATEDVYDEKIGGRVDVFVGDLSKTLDELLYKTDEQKELEYQYLLFLTLKGLKARGKLDDPKYIERINEEITVIKKMGYCTYFLVFADIFEFATKRRWETGPGRGSVCGCLLAWALRITDVDSLKYDLYFPRFLNEHRSSPPDIDVDFSISNRATLIKYLERKYKYTCGIGTFPEFAGRNSIDTVCRQMNLEPAQARYYCNLVPKEKMGGVGELRVTLSRARDCVTKEFIDAYEVEARAFRKEYRDNREFHDIVNTGIYLEGVTKGRGMHPAGLIISPYPLHEAIVPLARVSQKDTSPEARMLATTQTDGGKKRKVPNKKTLLTEFDKDAVEDAGLLKLDLLVISQLDAMNYCRQDYRELGFEFPDWSAVDHDDPEILRYFWEGRTDGIFQCGSTGMKQMFKGIKPDNVNDVSLGLALYRPGPMAARMHIDVIRAKHGGSQPHYSIGAVRDALRNTYGTLAYQEQVMAILQSICGFSMAEADLARRAIGKKDAKKMAKVEALLIEGGTSKGYAKKDLAELWEMIAEFAKYSFNASHSTAYAVLAIRGLYMRHHFPAGFWGGMAHIRRGDKDPKSGVDERARMLQLARSTGGVDLHLPDINMSRLRDHAFTLTDLRIGLEALKGVGPIAARMIVDERELHGEYVSLKQAIYRLAVREDGALNKSAWSCLIDCGAFDKLEPEMNRAEMHQFFSLMNGALEKTRQKRRKAIKKNTDGQVVNHSWMKPKSSSKRAADAKLRPEDTIHVPDISATEKEVDRILGEERTIGLSISGSVMKGYYTLKEKVGAVDIVDLLDEENVGSTMQVFCRVMKAKQTQTRKGTPMGIVTIRDSSDSATLRAFSRNWERSRAVAFMGDTSEVCVATVKSEMYRGEVSLGLVNLQLASALRSFHRGRVLLREYNDPDTINLLVSLPAGETPVDLEICDRRYRLGYYEVDGTPLERSLVYTD